MDGRVEVRGGVGLRGRRELSSWGVDEPCAARLCERAVAHGLALADPVSVEAADQ